MKTYKIRHKTTNLFILDAQQKVYEEIWLVYSLIHIVKYLIF